ncbi:uncharacterized protein I303_103940 [Kwoniella dejecticola CBS 10117]|uniref:Uncharacterized protein n=1 Tax=Kwoniella dejecticola CBS 10117 TaxID=1296121 RepID=A0A1A6A856_9TREE|nr:uncharacterized protein I303_03957 [Kwoniella dejecticola CBS 10117]OBR86237.1 hypothetical protein I303_03957 [Kwoniella dejecticola CBS 10117]
MPLREADLSATPIDDGSLTPLESSSANDRPRDPNDRSNQPRSPQPKLVLFDPRSGEQETIELGSASSILTLEDYKRLNRRTTERGMITGLLGGGVLTYLVRRFMPKTPSRNALSLTFLFSSAFISFSTSRALLVSEILRIRAQARANALSNGDMTLGDNAPPSDPMFSGSGLGGVIGNGSDTSGGTNPSNRSYGGSGNAYDHGTSPRDLRSPESESRSQSSSSYTPPGYNTNSDLQRERDNSRMYDRDSNVRDELAKLGKLPQIPQGRTRFPKGRGLEGEVEEENEMRDPYATPGQPRLG